MLKRRKKQLSKNGNTPPRLAELVPESDPTDPLQMAFISDLHLFSSRCNYERHEATIRRAVEASDVCVWGGDLFDFCWSRIGGGDVSRKAAIDWLEAWRAEFPEKTFVYLTGNHDAQAAFRESLDQWARPHTQPENLSPSDTDGDNSDSTGAAQHVRLPMRPGSVYVGLDAIRLADTLMVHGDVIEGGRNSVGLDQYRNRWAHEPATSPANLQNGLYDAAVTVRLLHWARQQPDWMHHNIGQVVFGHTHRCLRGVHVAGIDFYNAGAAVKHVKFEPVVLPVSVSV